jgi:hypothetical protein
LFQLQQPSPKPILPLIISLPKPKSQPKPQPKSQPKEKVVTITPKKLLLLADSLSAESAMLFMKKLLRKPALATFIKQILDSQQQQQQDSAKILINP